MDSYSSIYLAMLKKSRSLLRIQSNSDNLDKNHTIFLNTILKCAPKCTLRISEKLILSHEFKPRFWPIVVTALMQWLTRIQSIAVEYDHSAFYGAKIEFTMTAWGHGESFTLKLTELSVFHNLWIITKIVTVLCVHTFFVLAWNVTDSVSLWLVCHSYLAMLHTGLLSDLNICQINFGESRLLLFTLACNQLLAASFPVIKTFRSPLNRTSDSQGEDTLFWAKTIPRNILFLVNFKLKKNNLKI